MNPVDVCMATPACRASLSPHAAVMSQKEEDEEDPDAESRVNAVKALAACAQELYSCTTADSSKAEAAVQLRQAVHAAIKALDDYSIDNRYLLRCEQ